MNYWQKSGGKRQIGIRNLMLYIVIGMGIVFVLDMMFSAQQAGMEVPSLTSLLAFDRSAILAGEVWRVVSFIFLPANSSPLWILFSLYFYWLIGNSLEAEWGVQRFNLYYLIGVLGTVASGFIMGSATNFYLNMSLFFAAATLFPNFEMMIFFLIPVKLKWLGLLNAAVFVYGFLIGTPPERAAILFALLNYLIFFGKKIWQTAAHFFSRNVRKTQFKASKKQGEKVNQRDVISKEDKDYWKNR